MKFKIVFFAILLSLLTGCTSVAPAMTFTAKATSTPVATQTATQTPSPTATLSPEQQLIAIVNEAKKTNTFPTGLTIEQKIAFIDELNNQAGEKFGQKHWVDVEIDLETKKVSILLDGKWIAIDGSENISVEQWQTPITKANIDEKMASGEFLSPKYNELLSMSSVDRSVKEFSNDLVIVVLLPIKEGGLDVINGIHLLPELRISFITDENGKTVPIGERAYQAVSQISSFVFLEEGSKSKAEVFHGDYFADGNYKKLPMIKEFGLYYTLASNDPGKTIDQFSNANAYKGFIKGPDFAPIDKSYDALINADLNRNGVPVIITSDLKGVLINIKD
jgi:hypothetical protein